MSRGPLFRAARLLRWPDRLRCLLGIFEAGDVDEQVAGLLERQAELFLRAGGSLSLRTWSTLDPTERGALVVAGERIAIDRATVTGVASQGADEALALHGLLDGGRVSQEITNHAAAVRIAGEMRRKGVRA